MFFRFFLAMFFVFFVYTAEASTTGNWIWKVETDEMTDQPEVNFVHFDARQEMGVVVTCIGGKIQGLTFVLSDPAPGLREITARFGNGEPSNFDVRVMRDGITPNDSEPFISALLNEELIRIRYHRRRGDHNRSFTTTGFRNATNKYRHICFPMPRIRVLGMTFTYQPPQ
jgi:hypothetical protein